MDCAREHSQPAAVEIGTGDIDRPTFASLPEDGRIRVYPGPQRGYHAFFQVRASGICPNKVIVQRRLREPGQTRVLRQQEERMRMVAGEEEGTWVMPQAQPTFICPSTQEGVAMAGRQLDLEVTLTEEPGECDEALDARTVTSRMAVIPTCAETDTLCQEDSTAGCAAP